MTDRRPPQRKPPPPEVIETVREATALLAIRCETHPHEHVNGRCAWCGKPEYDGD